MWAMPTTQVWSGITRLWRGDLPEAEALLRGAVDDFALWGHLRGGDAHAASFLALVLVERGNVAQARAALDAPERPSGARELTRVWLGSLAELLLAEGRAEQALDVADELGRSFPYIDNPAWAPWRSTKARALDRLGRSGEAAALLVEELELARRWGAAAAIGRALRLLGTVKREAGLAPLHEAVRVLAGSPAQLEAAKAAAALGQALRRARARSGAGAVEPGASGRALRRDRARPRGPRRAARDGRPASPRGAPGRGLADHERAAGGRPRGGRSLQPRHRASPLRDAETVEMHLGNTYRKLGIRSRSELAAALEPPGRLR
jgi:tetratricopeptide (TPR) repeat protein